jgi:hypothetical protein
MAQQSTLGSFANYFLSRYSLHEHLSTKLPVLLPDTEPRSVEMPLHDILAMDFSQNSVRTLDNNNQSVVTQQLYTCGGHTFKITISMEIPPLEFLGYDGFYVCHLTIPESFGGSRRVWRIDCSQNCLALKAAEIDAHAKKRFSYNYFHYFSREFILWRIKAVLDEACR